MSPRLAMQYSHNQAVVDLHLQLVQIKRMLANRRALRIIRTCDPALPHRRLA